MRYSALLNPTRVALNIVVAAPVLALGYGARAWPAPSSRRVGDARASRPRCSPARCRAPSPGAPQPGACGRSFASRCRRRSRPPARRRSSGQTRSCSGACVPRRRSPSTRSSSACSRRPRRLDLDRPDVRAADRGRGRARRPRHARGDAEARDVLERLARDPGLRALLLLPGPLLRLFGPGYATGATALAILAAGQLFNAATGPLGQLINMSGRPYLTLVNNAAGGGAEHRRLPDPDPALRAHRRRLLDDRLDHAREPVKLVAGPVALRRQPLPPRGCAGVRRRPRRRRRRRRRSRCSSPGRGRCCRSVVRRLCSFCRSTLVLFWRSGAGAEERELLRPRARAGGRGRPMIALLAAAALGLAAARRCRSTARGRAREGRPRPGQGDDDAPVSATAPRGRRAPAARLHRADREARGRQYAADGVKVADGVHDLTVGGGSIRCLAKAPTLHQDGIQVMGGVRITFQNLSVDCGRRDDAVINSNLFFNQAGESRPPPTDVVCDGCSLGGGAAHTVSIQTLGALRRRLDALPRPLPAADGRGRHGAQDPSRATDPPCGPGQADARPGHAHGRLGERLALHGPLPGAAARSPVAARRGQHGLARFAPGRRRRAGATAASGSRCARDRRARPTALRHDPRPRPLVRVRPHVLLRRRAEPGRQGRGASVRRPHGALQSPPRPRVVVQRSAPLGRRAGGFRPPSTARRRLVVGRRPATPPAHSDTVQAAVSADLRRRLVAQRHEPPPGAPQQAQRRSGSPPRRTTSTTCGRGCRATAASRSTARRASARAVLPRARAPAFG